VTTASDVNADGSSVAPSSIRRKLTAIIMGVSSAALVLSGVLIVLSQMAAFRKNMALDHVLRAQMIANNCLAAVSFDDSKDASAVLRSLSSQGSVTYASVDKADGKILASYRHDAFRDEPQPFSACGEHAFTTRWLLTRAPIVLDDETIGTVFLQSDLSKFTDFRRQMITIVAVSLLIVFLLAWSVSFRLQKLISKPIESLTEIVRDVSRRRDYTIRATNVSGDEVGVLARAFNEMLSEVELRDEKLKEREQRTQEYLDVARVMIVALDLDGFVTLMNPKGCEIMGMKETEIMGKDWIENFIPTRLRENAKKVFAELIRGETPAVQYYENEVMTSSGEERLIAWNTSMIRDEAGRAISILFSGEDVTDRRQSEKREVSLRQQLARAERIKSIGVLAGSVAHDLNNTLGPMVVLPELIEEDMKAATQGDAAAFAEIQESLDAMKVSAERAASVVRDLVALSGRGHYERIPTDLNKMDCLTSESSHIKSLGKSYPNIRIELHCSSDALVVLASENHLGRVVDNLIRNAAEAIGERGTVTVTTSKTHFDEAYSGYEIVPPGGFAIIEVADTGLGIKKGNMGRIFEPFYTDKEKTDHSGSGLGLSIVHGIVEDHNGYIDIESKVGRGTTFRLYLPLTSSDQTATASDTEPWVGGTGRILVVDDEPGQRFLAAKSLTRLGYTVGLAENGRVAVQMFAEAKELQNSSPYDLVILDMVMEGGFDGFDTFQEMLALYPEQKVLIASGHAEDSRSMAALKAGAQWLAKPYSLNNIAKAVAGLLQTENS